MRRFPLLALLVFAFWFSLPSPSHAGFGLELSFGANYDLVVADASRSQRLGLNTELILSWQLLFISIDLGTLYDFNKFKMFFRPGVRFFLGWFYFRVAIPLGFSLPQDPNDSFNMGALVGIGARIKFGKFGIFFEANVSPFFVNINERGVLLPAEGRFGVGYYF